MRYEEEQRRAGARPKRYTGDDHLPQQEGSLGGAWNALHRPQPQRFRGSRTNHRPSNPAADLFMTRLCRDRGAPPVPVMVADPATPVRHSRSHSRSRQNIEPIGMPAMPPDPQGILHRESGSEEERRRRERSPPQPVSVKVKVHDDKDRNVTLRRLTEQEAAAARRDPRHRRNDSMSSLSGGDTPSSRRYRRDSSAARRGAEARAESQVEDDILPPLSPPNPAFAAGRRPKDLGLLLWHRCGRSICSRPLRLDASRRRHCL